MVNPSASTAQSNSESTLVKNLETQLTAKDGGTTEALGNQTKDPISVTTTITINITVDTKETSSVDNLLKIIRALKGEKETPPS